MSYISNLRGAISDASTSLLIEDARNALFSFWQDSVKVSFANLSKRLSAAAQGEDNSVNAKARLFFVENYIPVAVVGGFFIVVFPILVYMYYRNQTRIREKQEEQRRKLHVSNSKLQKRINEARKGKSKTPYGSPGSDSEGPGSPGSPSSGDDNTSDYDGSISKKRGDDLENGSVVSKSSRQKANIKKIDAEISKINYMGINREEADDIKAESPEHQLFLDFLSVLVTSDVQKAIKNLTKFNGTLRGKLNLPVRSLPANVVDLMDKSEREVTSKNMTQMRKYAYELFIENETLRKKTSMVTSPTNASEAGKQRSSASPPPVSSNMSQVGKAPLISQKLNVLPSKTNVTNVIGRGNNTPIIAANNNRTKLPNVSTNTQEPYEPYSPAESASAKRLPSPPALSSTNKGALNLNQRTLQSAESARAVSPNISSKQYPSLSLQKLNITQNAAATTTPGTGGGKLDLNRTAPPSLGSNNLQSIINTRVSTTPGATGSAGRIPIGGSTKLGGGSNSNTPTISSMNSLGRPSTEKPAPTLRLGQTTSYSDSRNSALPPAPPSISTTPGIRSLLSSNQSTRVMSPPLAMAQSNQSGSSPKLNNAPPVPVTQESQIKRNNLTLNTSTRAGQSPAPSAASMNLRTSGPVGLSQRAPVTSNTSSESGAYQSSTQIGTSNAMEYRSNPLAKNRASSSTKVDSALARSPEQQLGRSISTSKINIQSISTRGAGGR